MMKKRKKEFFSKKEKKKRVLFNAQKVITFYLDWGQMLKLKMWINPITTSGKSKCLKAMGKM